MQQQVFDISYLKVHTDKLGTDSGSAQGYTSCPSSKDSAEDDTQYCTLSALQQLQDECH